MSVSFSYVVDPLTLAKFISHPLVCICPIGHPGSGPDFLAPPQVFRWSGIRVSSSVQPESSHVQYTEGLVLPGEFNAATAWTGAHPPLTSRHGTPVPNRLGTTGNPWPGDGTLI